MSRKEFLAYSGVVALFTCLINSLAYLQFIYMIQISAQLHFFIIPTLVGLIFGSILVLYRHYYTLARQKEHFERIAKTDTLTGSMSRYACELILDHESKRCLRHHTSFALLMVDIDNFKRINDRYGHLVGDRILKQVCVCIDQQLRDMDTLCRWGGEEFLIILPELDHAQLHHVAQRLLHAIQTHHFGLHQPVTVSIGGACDCDGQCDTFSLIEMADKALYHAKQEGKNRVYLH